MAYELTIHRKDNIGQWGICKKAKQTCSFREVFIEGMATKDCCQCTIIWTEPG